MNAPSSASKTGHLLPRWLVGLIALLVLAAAVWGYHRWRQNTLADQLLRTDTQLLQKDTALLAYATQRAIPLYKEHCASCHGADLKGDRSRGVPNLTDSVWLYGLGTIADIEETITYGIRSGHPKARNLTDMPGLGRIGQLTPTDVKDVVEYVRQISHQDYDATAAEHGQVVFQTYGVCYDCHGSDGYGVSDYGTPPLTGRDGSWLYGGDRATLYKSVFDGRHGLCPAWINTLNFADIRALAAYLYQQSQAHTATKTAAATGN